MGSPEPVTPELHHKGKYVHPGDVIRLFSSDILKGVKVTFINMPLRETALPNTAPLGPALLAARLRQYGASPSIVDLNAYRIQDEIATKRGLPTGRLVTYDESEELLAKHFRTHGDQHLVAFSGIITTLRWQEEVARMVKRLQPKALIATGNGLATEFKLGLLNWIPELNAVAHSEGDDSIIKMAYDAKVIHDMGFRSALLSGKLDPYFVAEIGGQPRFLYEGGRPADLDTIPFPAWDLLEEDVNGFRVFDFYLANPVWGGKSNNSSAAPFTMNRSATTVSSRGCPFACKFCYRGAQGERNYGVRSAGHLAEEIRWYVEKYGVDFIGISDDNFMVDPRRIADLVPIMEPLVKDTGIRWGTHGRLDEAADMRPDRKNPGNFIVANDRRVDMMARAGCVYIGFGAESADPVVLELMGKGGFILTNGTVKVNGFDFPRTMIEGVKNTKRSGIHGNCTWIMAYPGEKLEHLKTSVAFIKWQEEFYTQGQTPGTPEYEVHRDSVNRSMFTATAYPGTEMFKHPAVRKKLEENFKITFDATTGEPNCDEHLRYYTLELDDATKVLQDPDGNPLNFSEMPMDVFLQARDYVDTGEIYKILDM